ncbi:autophagy- protein 2 [Coemansia sp. RSA 552]|nr:autophagy- protein 2 [Coemansia sp. RSA 552]
MWPANWSFSLPSWIASNSLQKRLVKFLLRRTVGQFLKTELDDENLDVQLSGGHVRLRDVELSEEASSTALNDAIAGLPVIVDSGAIGRISVSVPWTQLWTGHCEIQIDELTLKSRLVDYAAGDDGPEGSDEASNNDDKGRGRAASRSNMAESIVMTEGGASILTSSVFIADDFLRAETLGYGEKDEVFINKDVERLVATAHEERAQLLRSRASRKGAAGVDKSERPPDQPKSSQREPVPLPGRGTSSDEDVFEDSNDGLPMPSSPGGAVQGLQVVSEMVDRIISAVNVRVEKIIVECSVGIRDDEGHKTTETLQLSVDSIELLDEKTAQPEKTGPLPGSTGHPSSGSGSGEASPRATAEPEHPADIEYKVVQFRTLHKLLEIRGLRLSIASAGAEPATILSTFGAPVSAHTRIHRRMPFSELAPVRPEGSSNRRHGSEGSGESVYMGPMPGEFREAKAPEAHSLPDPLLQVPSAARVRNGLGEEPMTSGWDAALNAGNVAGVMTKEQLARMARIARVAVPLVRRRLEHLAMRDRYHERFGAANAVPAVGSLPQLTKWVSINLKHVYIAIVPQPGDVLDAWHESSLAVLRLKLETVKHLALYLKGFCAKWESAPPAGTASAPSGLVSGSGFMDTDFWAAMTREACARPEDHKPPGDTAMASGEGTVSFTACLQSFALYDSSPEHHPVVLPLISIDRSLGQPGGTKSEPSLGQASQRSKYDVWVHTSTADRVLAINVAPVSLVLNKELADRLAAYQELFATVFSGNTNSKEAPAMPNPPSDNRDVAESIEKLMGNLRLGAEKKMPSNIAVCSPLIRTWIMLPGAPGSASQVRARGQEDRPAPGHFCIDAVDAVITNVVSGTATSSQSPNSFPEGHMRHPHIKELLESRRSVGGSGVRVECESLRVYVQAVEGGSTAHHIGSVHEPSRRRHALSSIPRPHVEITMVTDGEGLDGDYPQRPPAFDAFAAVNDNIRVRMAPESELTTTLEFERLAVSSSRVVVSCHLPESDVALSRATYQRLNAIINDFLLWQSVQEEAKAAGLGEGGVSSVDTEHNPGVGVSVLVDMPSLTARVNSSEGEAGAHIDIPNHLPRIDGSGRSQRLQLENTQLFLSNAVVEKGRTYVSVEANQARLSSFVGETETEVVVSHTYATSESPIISPQLALFLLTSPTITEESEVVLKTTWTTLDLRGESQCLRELEAFFSSSGTSGMVQPPPKPMRLSLNVQNSSLRWVPSAEPSMNSAVLSVDSLAVILGINSPVPDRDNEELRYYVEGLSIFGRPADSQSFLPVDVSNDAWISTGRFWKDHRYVPLLHMGMVDLVSRSKEGDGGPLLDLRLYSEALVVDACADSLSTLPLLAQGLVKDFKDGTSDEEQREQRRRAKELDKRRSSGPQVLEKASDDIFGDIEEDAFVSAAPGYTDGRVLGQTRMSGRSHMSSSHSTSNRSLAYEFEGGHDDIDILVMDDYFVSQDQPDVADEYEVIGGQALSPTSPRQPAYSKRAQSTIRPGVPIKRTPHRRPHPPALSPHNSTSQTAPRRLSVDTKSLRGQDRRMSEGAEELGFSDDDHIFDLQDCVDMDGDVLSADDDGREEEGDHGMGGSFVKTSSRRRSLKLQSRFAAAGNESVVLEPDFPASDFISQRPREAHPPRAEFIDLFPDSASMSRGPVQVIAADDAAEGAFIDDARGSAKQGEGDFEIIDDYFKAPDLGIESTDSSDSEEADGDRSPILLLTVDVARVEVNLHSGQDWYLSVDSPGAPQPFAGDMDFISSYMDSLNEVPGSARGGQVSASMPEYRGIGGGSHGGSNLGSPVASRKQQQQQQQQAPRAARRSEKPKIELRAVHVHSEYRQFSEASSVAFDLGLNVEILEILDELESSEWSKFLTRRRDAKTGQPTSLHSLATARNRKLLTSGTMDSDRVTHMRMRRQKSSRWADSNAEPMICLQVESVRPYAALPAVQELRVDVELSPVRCYIHQDALDFLIGFFEAAEQHTAGSGPSRDALGPGQAAAGAEKRRRMKWHLNSSEQPYFQIVRIAPINLIFDYKPRRMRTSTGADASGGKLHAGASPSSPTASLPDRSGGRVGSTVAVGSSRKPMELLNFFPLEDAEMTLSTVKVRGVAGMSKLVRSLARSWLPHLTQTQIPGVVSGMTPLRSLVNFGGGVADLVILPLEQYRKDGRLVHGFKRGARSFARTTAMEAIQLGAKVAVNAQTLLEQAGDILNVDINNSPNESGSLPHSHDSRWDGGLSPQSVDMFPSEAVDWPDYVSMDGRSIAAGGSEFGASSAGAAGSAKRTVFSKSKYAKQPENLSDGMRQAYASLRSNVGDAVQTVLAIPVVVQEEAGDDDGGEGVAGRSPVHGSVRAVVRAVPVAVLKPMIGATEAVSKTLLGLRNTMEPTRRSQLEDKYKSRSLGAKKSYPS